MSAADQRAFWINAYNARVVAGVLSRYPIDSIKDVGFLGGRIRGFYGRDEHQVAGRQRSLDDIRALVTRAPLGDPRAHFALTLAAESETRFFLREVPIQIEFTRGNDGCVDGFTREQGGKQWRMERLAE